MSKTAFIVDSACSLPAKLQQKYNITLLPIHYSVDEQPFEDPCNPDDAVEIFESGVFARKHEVNTLPPSPNDFEKVIIDAIKSGHTRIVVQTLSRWESDIYENAQVGVAQVKEQLDGRDIDIHVWDSSSLISGQAVMITETVARVLKNQDPVRISKHLEKLSGSLATYILPKDSAVLLDRTPKRNEANVGWAKALVAKTLNICPIICHQTSSTKMIAKVMRFNKAVDKLFQHAQASVQAGLNTPILSVAYAGPLSELEAIGSYQELKQICKDNKVMLLPSVMSVPGAIYCSTGSIVMSFSCADHSWRQ